MNAGQFVQVFQRAIGPLKTRVLLMIGRAVLTAIKDDGGIQTVQMKALSGESFDGVPRVQEFGFSSNPPPGTDGIVVAVGGARESLVVIATDHKTYRFKNLASGESVFYTDDGTYIHLKKNGQIKVHTATKVLIEAPDVEITGNLKVGGTTHGVGAAQYDATLTVDGIITGKQNISALALVQAAGYSGPVAGGPGAAMVTSVPIQSTAAITTTADVQAANVTASGNVTGGGTDMATLKTAHNTHKHTATGATNPTTVPDTLA